MIIPNIQIQLDKLQVPGWQIGSILSSMFVVQILTATVWGKISDCTGRKIIIVACTIISSLSMVAYALAPNAGFILLSRILAGLGGANIAIAQAYIADLSASGSKVAGMGRIGAAISAGLIAGPALGGWLGGLGGHQLVGFVAGTLSLTGAILGMALLPKVKPTEREARKKGELGLIRSVPGLFGVFFIIAIGWFSLATLEGTFGRLIHHRFSAGEREFGMIFAFESLLSLITQSYLVERIDKKLRTKTTLAISYLGMGIGLVMFPFVPQFWMLFAASAIYAIASAMTNPLVNALCSEITPENRQGELFGLIQSVRSLGFAIGPTIGGSLFDLWPAAPYVLAMGACFLAAISVPKLTPKFANV